VTLQVICLLLLHGIAKLLKSGKTEVRQRRSESQIQRWIGAQAGSLVKLLVGEPDGKQKMG
jgi:hypothetical protein